MTHNSTLTKISCILFLSFSLLFSSDTFAYSMENLREAVLQDDFGKAENILQEIDPNKLKKLTYLPSVEMGMLLLKTMDPDIYLQVLNNTPQHRRLRKLKPLQRFFLTRLAIEKGATPSNFDGAPISKLNEYLEDGSMDPTDFIVALADTYRYMDEDGYEDIAEEIPHLIRMSLRKGANCNKIQNFGKSLRFSILNIFIEDEQNPMDPNKFMLLVMEKSYNKNNIEGMAARDSLIDLALKKGAIPNQINYPNGMPMPSLKMAELLLKDKQNPMDPNILVEIVKHASYRESKKDKNSLLKLALENGADPNQVENTSPSLLSECKELFVKTMGADQFLALVIENSYYYDEDKKKELVGFALENSADLNQIKHPSAFLLSEYGESFIKAIGATRFLDLAIQQHCDTNTKSKLIELALENGANTNDFSFCNQGDILSIKSVKIILERETIDMDCNNWLIIVLKENIDALDDINSIQAEELYHVIKLALEKEMIELTSIIDLILQSQIRTDKQFYWIKLILENNEIDKVNSFNLQLELEAGEQWLDHINQTKFLDLARKVIHDKSQNTNAWLSLDSINSLLDDTTKHVDVNRLLVSALNSRTDETLNHQKNDTVKRLLEKEADPQKINIEFTEENLPPIETFELLFSNGDRSLDPNHFIRLISRIKGDKLHNLFMLALEKGVNLNTMGMYQLISNDPKILDLSLNSRYKKLNIDFFRNHLNDKHLKQFMLRHGLDSLLLNPKTILDTKYKNLNAKTISTPKIPRTLHHIWLTNEKEKREPSAPNIQNVLKTHHTFLETGKDWKQIVWTNNKSLIPGAVKILEANNVEVKEISEINNHFQNKQKIDDMIKQGRWGTASDILRYELINNLGGVYTDLDFDFMRNIENEIHKYDFIGSTDDNVGQYMISPCFFAAKKNHPVLKEATVMLADHFSTLPELITKLGEKGLQRTNTYEHVEPLPHASYKTVNMLAHAYYKTANRNETTDAVYPFLDTKHYGFTQTPEPPNTDMKNILIKRGLLTEPSFFEHLHYVADYLNVYDMHVIDDHLIGSAVDGRSWQKEGLDSVL